MKFPTHDKYWVDTANFLKENIQEGEKIVAPTEFAERFPGKTKSYSGVISQDGRNYDLVVIHKGMMDDLEYSWLMLVTKEYVPLFANEVFVIFSKNLNQPQIDKNLVHWQAFDEKMQNLATSEINLPKDTNELQNQSFKTLQQDSIDSNTDYATLSLGKIKELMDHRYESQNAYSVVYLWDEVRAKELNKHVIEAIFPTNESRILEIGCGIGGSAAYIDQCKEYIGTDLSDAAISQAYLQYGNKQNFQFMTMDAMNLKFEDNRFDVVIAKEVIEHLPNPVNCVKEAFRVLKTGGIFIVTSPNRDSLHLRVNRMLGYENFKCSFDHIKEFTFEEASEMLIQEGFKIKKTKGAFLMPYWGISTVDTPVRHLTDNDPIMVEMLRELGERVGAEYGFCFIIICEKP
ncbi:class I SAM-dependent methyltransferase [Fortiea contorta]|uniref:class I SAM-dependent methyltransferase n=1 Tax=Fortiea contorta TaxID=1892405 RepID=UPI000347F761|nr:class I SAM-dependent methyltransferase [Fortiea contorta]